MKLEADWYTKVILTVIAIGLLLNAGALFIGRPTMPTPAFAGSVPMEVRIEN
ncbi:MAG: hypothetical protein NTX30_22480 [Deltaproteobacteria bacterium]|nr:hypothetical protein [Deltaproteobacteria bacterium]